MYKIFLPLLGLTFALFAVELSLRLINPLDREKGANLIESSGGERNSSGLRERQEFSTEHSNYRIIAVGDSFTYGVRLKPQHTLPKILEKRLQSHNLSIEVLNGGRPGTNTGKQLEIFQKSYASLRPDMVLIVFLINDCTTLCSNCGPVLITRAIHRMSNNPSVLERIFYTYRFAKITLLKRRMTAATVEEYMQPYREEAPSYVQCIDAFRRFKQLSVEQRFELKVALYPMLFGMKGEYPFAAAHHKVRSALEEMGIESIDLTPAFHGRDDTELWVHPSNSHPNKMANVLAAEYLAPWVRERAGTGVGNPVR